MSKPLSKVRLQSSAVLWAYQVVAYRIAAGCLLMTLLLHGKRVRFQLRPDGIWRRRIRRKGANYWRRANAWDALQCRLAYGSYCKVYPRAPTVTLSRGGAR